MDFGKMEVFYFCDGGWTGVIGLKWLGKSRFWRSNPLGSDGHSALLKAKATTYEAVLG
jgi:hypothetical protein